MSNGTLYSAGPGVGEDDRDKLEFLVQSSVSECLDSIASWRDRREPFLISKDGGLSLAEIDHRLDVALRAFADLGLVRGDRVLIGSGVEANDICLFLASLRAGITAVMIDPNASKPEVAGYLRVTQPRACWLKPGFEGFVRDSGARVPEVPNWKMAVARKRPMPQPDSVIAAIVFTSGTTSDPKGVQLTHGALKAQVLAFAEVYGFGPQSRILNVLPIHHVDGLIRGVLAAAVFGGELLRPGSFSIAEMPRILSFVREGRATHFVAVPAMLSLILRLSSPTDDWFEGEDLQCIISSADLLEEALWRRFEERFNKPVSNSWGQSETVCDALYAGPATETRRYGTIGRPVGCEARVVDEANRPVPDGDIGELQIRGPIVMAGYVNNPEATSQVMAGDWLRTGDLVHRSNDGFFRFVGRKRNMIVSRGVSIHPESVTAALRTSDAVVEAVAIGTPHDDWGERIVAFVVLAAPHSTTIAELHDLCREQLAPEKRPERIIVLPELPRGPAGKVRLDALRKKFSEIEAIRGDHASSLSIYEIAGQVFGMRAADLSPQSTPYNTPNWDSFAHIELIVAVEAAFNIVMTTEDILGLTSLADVENMV